MPSGFVDAMGAFTKILKSPFVLLRQLGHLSVVYVDDTYLRGQLFVEDTMALLQALGFIIHSDKSQLIPSQKMTVLGFVTDSTKMTLKLTENKPNKLFALCGEVIKSKVHSIRKIAGLLGNIAASFEAVPLGPLHYRNIQLCKIAALKAAKR